MNKRDGKALFEFFKNLNGKEIDVQVYCNETTEEPIDVLLIDEDGNSVLSVAADGSLGARVLVGQAEALEVFDS